MWDHRGSIVISIEVDGNNNNNQKRVLRAVGLQISEVVQQSLPIIIASEEQGREEPPATSALNKHFN